jgi:hypothetical protein
MNFHCRESPIFSSLQESAIRLHLEPVKSSPRRLTLLTLLSLPGSPIWSFPFRFQTKRLMHIPIRPHSYCNERRVGGSVFLFSFLRWGETESTWYVGHYFAYCTSPGWWWGVWSSRWKENWQGKPKYSEKTCRSATLSTTKPTWFGLEPVPPRWESGDEPPELWHGQGMRLY